MALIPVSADRFGALNLAADPADVGMDGAVDLLNVQLDKPGLLRTRYGFTDLTSGTTPAADYWSLMIPLSKDRLVGVGLDTGVGVSYDLIAASTGNVQHRFTDATTFVPPVYWARIGTDADTLVYLTTGLVGLGISKFAQSTGAVTVESARPLYVAVLPGTNRLAQACYPGGSTTTPSGFNGTTSTVFFSDPGAPDTYTSSNWVELQPGDGEDIMGMGTWQDSMFVFKRTTMFVFSSTLTSTASDGTPVFGYRRVTLPEPFSYNDVQPVAGPDGLYYVSPGGIYRTAGGIPERVSDPVTPIFDRTAASSLALGQNTGTSIRRLSWCGERLFFNYANGDGAQRQLVWDRPTDAWTIWSLPTTSNFTQVQAISADAEDPTFVFFSGSESSVARVYRYGRAATTDDGAAISWRYQTGYTDIGGYYRGGQVKAAERKILRGVDILGSGTLTHQILALNARPSDVADPGGSVTLGTAPAVARGHRNRSARGTFFGHKLSGTGSVVLSGLMHWVQVESDT